MVKLESSGPRPSVETPLHDLLKQEFVVHTHPALVNGLTCAMDAEQWCAKLFPEALWVPYIDPGFSLYKRIREMVEQRRSESISEPSVIIMQNHGLIVAADSGDEVVSIHSHVFETLTQRYTYTNTPMHLQMGTMPDMSEQLRVHRMCRSAIDEDAWAIEAAPPCAVAVNALTPDHIVYSKAAYLFGEPDTKSVFEFSRTHGYYPRIVATQTGTFALGADPSSARTAMELALDGALVRQLTKSFGGENYLTKSATAFIENWEAEAYRVKVARRSTHGLALTSTREKAIEQAYSLAKEKYASVGVDTERAMDILSTQFSFYSMLARR